MIPHVSRPEKKNRDSKTVPKRPDLPKIQVSERVKMMAADTFLYAEAKLDEMLEGIDKQASPSPR